MWGRSFAVLTGVVLARAGYNELLANKLILVSDAAYCGDKTHDGTAGITEWTCAPCKAGETLSHVTVFANATRETLGFTGVTSGWEEGEYILVAFRGSVLNQNYADDLDTKLVTYSDARGGKVHRGFYQSYSSMSKQMFRQVQDLREISPNAKGILVTGHSLGAAQAVLGADDLARKYPDTQITMYSFGTPRTGNLAQAQRLNATSNLETWVVTHRADTVPRCGLASPPCPALEAKYNQIPWNIWYPEDLAHADNGDYIVCDGSGEDPTCEDSVAANMLNWDDHDVYFGHSMYCCDGGSHGPSGKGCPYPFSSSLRTNIAAYV